MYYKLKNHDILYNDAQLGPYPDQLLPRVDRVTNIPEGSEPQRKFQSDVAGNVVKQKAKNGEYSEKMNKIINEYQMHKDEMITLSFTNFFKQVILTMRDHQDDPEPFRAPLPDDPRAITRHIKSFCYFMGVDAVGVCEVPEYGVFKNNYKGEPFENTYKYAIVFLKRKSPQTTTASSGNDRIFDACSHQVYQLVTVWAQVLMKYIRKLGYDALASNQLNYVTVMTSMILAAGLGESGRMGLAVNPFFGANFKSACVLTNLPLVPDKPIDFGLKSFCDECHICADVCPAKAISADNEQELYNGYLKYKMSYEKHVLLGYVNTNCSSCGACTNMCPWNRPDCGPEYYRDWDGSVEELHRRARNRRDYLRENKYISEEQKHNQWWFDFMWDKNKGMFVIPDNAKFEIPPQEGLEFNSDNYKKGKVDFRGETISYREFSVPYVEKPNAPMLQTMNIYVREDMADDHSAPILLIHRDGGVGEAKPWSIEAEYAEQHTTSTFKGHKRAKALNAPENPESFIARALKEGYVLALPGVRGRESVLDGKYVGRGDLPMTIVDLKAAVRYLHYNKGKVPGDTEKIISEGGSSGGGSSALLGASGNSKLYEKYLKEIGAADARDDIFCALVDSPIHDFEHIDIAYEWQFGPQYVEGLFSDNADFEKISNAAAKKYVEYIDSLNLKNPANGNKLSITDESYQNFMLGKLNESLNKYLAAMTDSEKEAWLAKEENAGLASLKEGLAEINSFESYIKWNAGRWMKYVACYDGFDENPSRESEAFGPVDGGFGHFSVSLGEAMLTVPGYEEKAEAWIENAKLHANAVKLVDPYVYIKGEEKADIAPHWYVRAGGHHETTGAIFMNLSLLLENRSDLDVKWDFCWPQIHTAIALKECDETFAYLKEIQK